MYDQMKMVKLEVDVVSDTVCPWCYLGKRSFEAAVAELKLASDAIEIELTWRPYFLAPRLPADGVDKRASYLKKFRDNEDAMMNSFAQLARLGHAARPSIRFAFGGLIANTTASHALLDWALESAGRAAQARVVESLSRMYFEEECSVGSDAVLASAATEAGLDGHAAVAAAHDPHRRAKVSAEAKDIVRSHGVLGVPAFVVNGRHVVNGAQDTAVFARTLRKLAANVKTESSSAFKTAKL